MRKWLRNLLLASALIVPVLGFSLLSFNQTHDQPAKPEETVATDVTAGETTISGDQAIKIAAGLLGVDSSARHTAKLGKVTDNTVPFIKVVDLHVWKITFTDLAVTFPGAAQPKPEFSTLTCLVDARTGALLKVSSPLPATGGVIDNETHPEELTSMMKETNFTAIEASRLADAGVKPLIPLLPALEKQNKTIQPAKQLVAYLGLYTGNSLKVKYVDNPCWLVNTGGLKTVFGTDALSYVDATSGKVFKTRYTALPGEKVDFGVP